MRVCLFQSVTISLGRSHALQPISCGETGGVLQGARPGTGVRPYAPHSVQGQGCGMGGPPEDMGTFPETAGRSSLGRRRRLGPALLAAKAHVGVCISASPPGFLSFPTPLISGVRTEPAFRAAGDVRRYVSDVFSRASFPFPWPRLPPSYRCGSVARLPGARAHRHGTRQAPRWLPGAARSIATGPPHRAALVAEPDA